MLELRAVGKTHGEERALESLDLSFPEGKTTVIIGPSGCGKSTLLRLLMGLTTPDPGGSIVLAGEVLTDREAPRLRRGLGYVTQDGGLFPHMSAADNVLLLARHLGWEEQRCAARLSELAELTQLPAASLERFPSELSGGQRQRVSLMRALALDPAALLLDEPLGALDPMVRRELQEDLREVFRRLGKTVVLVTHDLAEAAFLGDEILLFHEGRLVQRGDFDSLVNEPADDFVRRFVNAQRSPLREAAS